ncbi:thiopurine S-methyltransferase-like [Styela clava]
MELKDWDRLFWKRNFIPWDFVPKPHNHLLRYDNEIGLKRNSRIFVPLCGMSGDMIWLANKGHEIVGIEYSEVAIRKFFNINKLEHQIYKTDLQVYKANNLNITIYQSNIFNVDEGILGKFDAIWDRAAFTSIPSQDRTR